MIKFDNCSGPSFNQSLSSVVPIFPITVSTQLSNGLHERQQLPLRLAWAMTIHKSQGLTLPKAWVNIGKSETTLGVSYVAISRVRTLASCIIEPMTYERLTHLKLSKCLHYHLNEEKRLDLMTIIIY